MQSQPSKSKARWNLLSKALLGDDKLTIHKTTNNTVSVRRFESFGLFHVEPCPKSTTLDSDTQYESSKLTWLRYYYQYLPPKMCGELTDCSVLNNSFLDLCLYQSLNSLEQLKGFNNTGNICVWPSEEALAYVLLTEHQKWLHNQVTNVCELGGGMTCFAGFLCALLSSDLTQVLLTDGNSESCENLHRIAASNRQLQSASLTIRKLVWNTLFAEEPLVDQLEDWSAFRGQFQLVICADCFFFTECHNALLATIDFLLSPKSANCDRGGVFLALAPSRSGTLERFVALACASSRFHVSVSETYSAEMTKRDAQLCEQSECYDKDLHFPKQVVITRL